MPADIGNQLMTKETTRSNELAPQSTDGPIHGKTWELRMVTQSQYHKTLVNEPDIHW